MSNNNNNNNNSSSNNNSNNNNSDSNNNVNNNNKKKNNNNNNNKILDEKVLKVQTDKVNEAIKYLKSKSITKMNNLIRAACVFVTGQIELKKARHREKNEPK